MTIRGVIVSLTFTMEPLVVYGLTLASIIIIFTLRPIALLIVAKFGHAFRSHVQYPLVISRNGYTGSISRLEVIYLTVYLATNGLVLGYSVRDRSSLSKRAAFAALVNLVPLYFGGRTNPLMSFIGFPLPHYYLAHHWFGRVAIIEALIHAVISLLPPQSYPEMTTSGYCVSTSLLWF